MAVQQKFCSPLLGDGAKMRLPLVTGVMALLLACDGLEEAQSDPSYIPTQVHHRETVLEQ